MSSGPVHYSKSKTAAGIFNWGDRTDEHKEELNLEEGSQQYFKYGEHNSIAEISRQSSS